MQSPRFGIYQNHTVLNKIKESVEKYHMRFFSYDNSKVFSARNLYIDASHLNDSGAVVFTRSLVSLINSNP